MKKKLIRGVALILVALSILLLAGSCDKWYDTTYTVKARGLEKDDWIPLSKGDNGYGEKIKVSPVDYDGNGIPNVKISSDLIVFVIASYPTPRYIAVYLRCSVNNIKEKVITSGEHKGEIKYVGSAYLGCETSVDLTFYKTKDPDNGNTVNALRIDVYFSGNYQTTYYAYD